MHSISFTITWQEVFEVLLLIMAKFNIKDEGFPEPTLFKVDDNGRITFSTKQWKWLLKATGSKAKTYPAQRRAIKKLVEDAIKLGLKRAKENEANAHR